MSKKRSGRRSSGWSRCWRGCRGSGIARRARRRWRCSSGARTCWSRWRRRSTDAAAKIVECPNCGNVDTIAPCTICQDPRRDASLIVVVEEIGDLWALERAGVVKGLYHVLGGHLSPLDGVGPEQLNIGSLIERAVPPVKEILLALNATVEGQSTAHYLTEQLHGRGITVTRLAQGVPIGGELDYLDEGTLAAAIKSRRTI